MKETTKAVLICLTLFFLFVGGCVALIGWDEFNAPVKTRSEREAEERREKQYRKEAETMRKIEKALDDIRR